MENRREYLINLITAEISSISEEITQAEQHLIKEIYEAKAELDRKKVEYAEVIKFKTEIIEELKKEAPVGGVQDLLNNFMGKN